MTYLERQKVLRGSRVGDFSDSDLSDGTLYSKLSIDCNRDVLPLVLDHFTKLCLMVNGHLSVYTFDHSDKICVDLAVSEQPEPA